MTLMPEIAETTARELMEVISAGSIPAMGRHCQAVLERRCGSPATGIYLLRGPVPELLFSSHVPDGFLQDYAALYGADDPMIRRLSPARPVTDGRSCFGEADWARSELRELLASWGLGHNMCGLVRVDEATRAVVYTAGMPGGRAFTEQARDQMELLCRAVGLVLRGLMREGPGGSLPPQLQRVAALICEGLSNKEIARAVGLSEHTVKEYVQRLTQRFRADNRTALAVALLRQGHLH